MPINLSVFGQTDVGLVRAKNEDTFVIADLTGGGHMTPMKDAPVARFEIGERGVLLAVSDGMGGHKAGEVASALVVQSLEHAMAKGAQTSDDALFEQAVKQANRDVWAASHLPGREHMGATLTALYVRGPTAYIAEVGDSRAYLLRNGVLAQVTRDQSYVQFLVDRGSLTPEQAEHNPFKHVILQSMGQTPNVSVALGKLELRQRDCLLICSDGLSNKVSPEEMQQVILNAPGLDAACATLIALANGHGGDDNITVILAGVSGDLPASVPGEEIPETLRVLKEFQLRMPLPAP